VIEKTLAKAGTPIDALVNKALARGREQPIALHNRNGSFLELKPIIYEAVIQIAESSGRTPG